MAMSRTAVYRSALLACVALIALAAGLALTPPAGAEPPGDLELIISLADDADNVVPPGSTVTVAASLRHSGISQHLSVSDGRLRIVGDFDFEGTGHNRVNIADQQVGAAAWRGSGAEFGDRFGAFGGTILDGDTFFIKSLQNEFVNGRWETAEGKFYVYDVPSQTEVAIIEPPAGAEQRAWGRGFAAYMEDADTGWIFVGSWQDTVTVTGAQCGAFRLNAQNRRYWANVGTQCEATGQLYIYKYDKSASDSADWTVELAATITPSAADASYRENATRAAKTAKFGIDVKLSDDGGTLVVGADRMDVIGAMLVFSKPSSSGSWGDLTYADGVKLSPTTVPAEQTIESSAPNLAKSYGGREWSTGRDGSGFGQQVQISGDGSVIASGTFFKQYNDNNQWYSSNCSGNCSGVGEVTVFVRPGGGWAADTTPNARLFVTPTVNNQRLGQYLAISHDGATIAASAAQRPQHPPNWPGKVFLWNRPSGGWTADITGAHAVLTAADGRNGDQFGHIGTDFNHDGSKLLVSNHKYQDADPVGGEVGNSNAGFFGRAWLFEGTNGAWASATTASATQIVSPEPRAAAFFGVARFAEDGRQVIIGQVEDASAAGVTVGPGAIWLFDENLEPMNFAGTNCEVDSGLFLTDSQDDINTCALELPSETEIVIPRGTPAGSFRVSGSVTVDGQTYLGDLEVQIGSVKEVAEVKFDFATDDRGTAGVRDDQPWPDAIAPGGSTVLQLSLLSEKEQPSAAGSVRSIVLSTTAGTLSTNINDAERAPAAFSTARRNEDGCVDSGGRACVVPTTRTALSSSNSSKILVTLSVPNDAEPAQTVVTARVLSATGESFVRTLTVSITGAFRTLQLGEPSQSVLNVGTPDSGDAGVRDNRDAATVAVTAQDAAGNDILVPGTGAARRDGPRRIPSHRLTIKDPDGKSNPAGISARWLANTAGTGLAVNLEGNPLIEIDVDAPAETPLATGEYTLEAVVNQRTWSRTFRVSGGPAALSLGEPEGSTAIGERVTLTATVTDADGNAVSDGTPVNWLDAPTSEAVVLVQTSQALETRNGLASATYLVIGSGTAYVRATSGTVGDIRLLTLGTVAVEPMGMTIAELLPPNTRPGALTTWPGEQRIEAAELLPVVNGARSVLLWQNGRWLRYAVVNGREVPGSVNFDILMHSVLWIGG